MGVTPRALGALRLLVGALALVGFALARGGFSVRRAWHAPALGLAALTTAGYQLFFFSGVQQAGVAIGTMVTIGSSPIFAALLGRLLLKEALNERWILATGIALPGLLVLSLGLEPGAVFNRWGVLWALLAGLSYALFTLANKRLLVEHSADEVMALSFSGGALLLAPLLIDAELGWITSLPGLVVVLHLGLLATGLSYILFGRGLVSVPIATAASLSLAEPLTAALLGILLLGERPTAGAWIGMALIFFSLGILMLQKNPHP